MKGKLVMDWNALVDFIQSEDEGFMAAVRGVLPEELERAEQNNAVRLPASYRQFVALMGRDSAGFCLFSSSESQNFDDLVASLPTESYPAGRYFKIAFPIDESDISPFDYFLDLSRSDGVDAPIVMFEDIGEFRERDVREVEFTFGEQVQRRIFAFLVLEPAPRQAMLVTSNATREESEASKRAALALLERTGFARVLPDLPRVTCLRRGTLAALVDEIGSGLGVVITLGGDDERTLEVVLDQLLERFPDAIVNRAGGPLAS
jgi:hypothetical protein